MQPIEHVTDDQLAYWATSEGVTAAGRATFSPPHDMPHCTACEAVITEHAVGAPVVHVPWKPSEIDLAHLARGGTIWLSTWNSLPPHMLEVQAP